MNRDCLLIVDDEPEICELIKEVAEGKGFEVEVAHNGEELRRALRTVNPSAIILDLMMPGEDGVELLRFLAERKCRARISLISGADAKVVKTAARVAGSYGLSACAEGVETGETMEMLRALRCDKMQGYLFSRPLPKAEATAFLRTPGWDAGRPEGLRAASETREATEAARHERSTPHLRVIGDGGPGGGRQADGSGNGSRARRAW